MAQSDIGCALARVFPGEMGLGYPGPVTGIQNIARAPLWLFDF